MNKSSLLAVMVLIGFLVLDSLSKILAISFNHFWGNSGLMLGFLSDLPPVMLILSLSSIASCIFLIYVCLLLYLHPKLLGLKLGISALVAGIFGNVIDKAYRGWTVDWIVVPWFNQKNVAFNLADLFLWIGILTILWWIFRREKDIWYPGDQRRNIWHSPKEQISFAMKFVFVVGGMCVMLGFFSYAFINQILSPLPADLTVNLSSQYLIVLTCLSSLFLLISFFIGIWISHRMIGPIIAFERHVEEILAGKNKEFRLRQGDMLKKLEEIASLIAKLSIIFISFKAWSYPQYISLQYTSCLTCHYNPQGNGPLNDYGRGVAATAIAGRVGIDKTTTEEDLVKNSSFPGIDPQTNSWLRPMIGYRGLGYDSNAFTGESQRRWINMQLDGSLVLKGGSRDQYIASFTYGTRPTNRIDQNNLMETKGYSREHYIGWRPTTKVGVYAGKMDKAFGLRIPDHNLTSRRATRTAQFDQVHGVMIHAVGETLEGSIHGYVGDLNESDETLRDEGFSGIFEWGVSAQNRLGVSYMNNRLGENQTTVIAVHDRLGLGKGHSLMAEVGEITLTPDNGEVRKTMYGFLQSHLMLTRGLWLQGTFDYYKGKITGGGGGLIDDEILSVGPGIQWFPRQKIELRLDIYNQRSFNETVAAKDSWRALAQVHLWL